MSAGLNFDAGMAIGAARDEFATPRFAPGFGR